MDRVWYEFGYFHQEELEFLRTSVRDRTEFAVDAGCGPGRHTVFLASIAKRVIAIDISRKMLTLARLKADEAFPGVANFVQADIRRLPLKSGIANLVINFEVLEHLADGYRGVLTAFREFRRILVPRGQLITETPLRIHRMMSIMVQSSRKEISAEANKCFYEELPLPVATAYFESEIRRLLGIAGFGCTDVKYVRVIPAGLVERLPDLIRVDHLLERIPLTRRLAREVIWSAAPQDNAVPVTTAKASDSIG